jgi:hypothetical protein
MKSLVHAAGGGNYQTLINDGLCEHIQQHREPLETILRRVLRERTSWKISYQEALLKTWIC